MRASRFNIIHGMTDGGVLAFNSASCTLLRIRPGKVETFRRALGVPGADWTDEEHQFHQVLAAKGFLVEDDVDELAHHAVRARRHRFGRHSLALTIAPTLACNFRCDYCYERASAQRMDAATEAALLAFAERRMRGVEQVGVVWFGGEPTLCPELIERVQAGLKAAAARQGARLLPSAIVTNGYALDFELATRLAAAGIASAQVTLDGPREVHDRRRMLAGGGPTFERILANLEAASTTLQCSVRVNVDERNREAALDLVTELDRRGLLGRVKPYFAAVDAAGAVCADIADHCFSPERFAALELDLYGRLYERGYALWDDPLPLPGAHCQADSDNAFVVAPDGLLFACWEAIAEGPAGAIGSVHAGAPDAAQRARHERYLDRDPFRRAACRDCNVLPLCLGGCPQDEIVKGRDVPGLCGAARFNLPLLLEKRVCGPNPTTERR